MNAWLLTWTFTAIEPAEKLVAILPSRRSERNVAELMEFLVLKATSGAGFNAFCVNRRKDLVYKANMTLVISKVPHGNRIFCGHDPWLYGRKVRNLTVSQDESSNEEIISWTEPDNYKLDEDGRSVVVADRGKSDQLRRRNDYPLSKDIWHP